MRLEQVDTSKGEWGVFVQSVVELWDGEELFLLIVLEQNIDDEHVRSRKLEMSVAASNLANPSGRRSVLKQICNWIETTEGDGSLVGT